MLTAALAPGEPAVFLSCQPDNIKEGYSDGLRLAERGGLRSIQIEREPLLQSPESLGAVLRNHELPTKGVVLLISPLGRMPKTPGRFDTSELASRNLVRCIPPELDVALALPGHALSGKTRSMLAEIAEGRHVRAVIQLPGELLMPGIYSKLQLFVAYLTHDVADRAAFVKMGPGGAVDVARQLAELWGGRPTVDGGFGLDPSEFDIANGILPDQLDPRRLQRVNEAIAIGEMHRVSDFCEVFPGQGRKVTQHETPSPDALPLLVGSHIHSGMILRDDNPDRAEPANRASLEPGDLVLRAIANAQKLVVAAQVEEVDLPLAASQSVIVVRPLPNLSGNQRRVLRYFVESDRFASQLTSLSLGSARRVTASEVADAKFPMADSDFSNALLAVESASADFAKWRDESLSQLRLSVDAKDLVASRAQLIRNSNHHRQRAAAGRLLDDLGHRVTTRYPLPVAYRWRRAVAALGGPEEINAVLHAQEVLLAYLAMMSLTFSRELGLGEGARKEISKQLSKDKRGLGLGQWGQIVSQTSKNREFKVLPPGHPLIDVRDFLRKPGVEHAASRLKLLRNSLAHLTEFGPGEAELAQQDT